MSGLAWHLCSDSENETLASSFNVARGFLLRAEKYAERRKCKTVGYAAIDCLYFDCLFDQEKTPWRYLHRTNHSSGKAADKVYGSSRTALGIIDYL